MRLVYLTILIIATIAFPIAGILTAPAMVVLVGRMIRDGYHASRSLRTLEEERDVLQAGKFFGGSR